MRYRCFLFGTLFAISVAAPTASFADCYHSASTCFLNYQPSAGFAGITKVYIMGTYFGATQGSSTVTFGGVAATQFDLWSDGMIIATVPDGAPTGNADIVVTTANGSDDSADAASLDWMDGTGWIAPNFVVYGPGNPSFAGKLDSRVGPVGCKYVGGSWRLDDGYGDTAQYNLTQSQTQNSDQTWNVTGSVGWSYYYGQGGTCTQNVHGTLDQNSNLIFQVDADPVGHCGTYGDAYKILDATCGRTSQGYFADSSGPNWVFNPPSNFLNNLGAGGDYPIAKAS